MSYPTPEVAKLYELLICLLLQAGSIFFWGMYFEWWGK